MPIYKNFHKISISDFQSSLVFTYIKISKMTRYIFEIVSLKGENKGIEGASVVNQVSVKAKRDFLARPSSFTR